MSTRRTQAFWIVAPGRAEIRAEPLRVRRKGEILVKTLYSAISRGTETIVFQGRVPKNQYNVMRAPHQAGEFPAPVKYGYISVGEVEEGPRALKGRTVFALYPHQSHYVIAADHVVPLPRGLPAPRAVLAANMETAINALWDAPPPIGGRIVVVGAGVVGCLAAYLAARVPGTKVTLLDIDPRKAAIAEALGVGFASEGEGLGGADLVIEASGAPDGLVSALALAGPEATVAVLSWFAGRPVALPLGEDFHARRLRMISSQVGAVAPAQRPRWDRHRRLALALDLLGDERLESLITGESPFRDLPKVMARLAKGEAADLCHRIRYD